MNEVVILFIKLDRIIELLEGIADAMPTTDYETGAVYTKESRQ